MIISFIICDNSSISMVRHKAKKTVILNIAEIWQKETLERRKKNWSKITFVEDELNKN